MSLVSSLKHSIFVRIYAGLLIVCLCVALFAQLLMDTINKERVQSYRESMANGAFHLVSEGIAHQTVSSSVNTGYQMPAAYLAQNSVLFLSMK